MYTEKLDYIVLLKCGSGQFALVQMKTSNVKILYSIDGGTFSST